MKDGKAAIVQLFATCLIETLRPEAGMAVVTVIVKETQASSG